MTSAEFAWQSRKPWRDALVRPVIPAGEGPTTPLSIRFSERLIAQLDRVADDTGNNRSEVVVHLVRWGLEEYERQRAEEKDAAKKR